jgi:2-polyprenyl-3-methyl-5-hydroxy-6-metoxy-1,4-benzoquinol methylase
MSDSSGRFYNDLADSYHLIFQDWTQSISWQASILDPLVEREMHMKELRILDCACGIGTQTLGLAQRGHQLMGIDLSEAAIERARREAGRGNLSIQFEIADMRDLSALAETGFDVVISVDNALPHLLSEGDLAKAVRETAGKLRLGGLFLATIRDYDQIVETHPPAPPPAFFQDGPYRRIYHQVWDWTSDRQYTAHL